MTWRQSLPTDEPPASTVCICGSIDPGHTFDDCPYFERRCVICDAVYHPMRANQLACHECHVLHADRMHHAAARLHSYWRRVGIAA